MFEELRIKVIEEYPFLENSNLDIVKKFEMSDGRASSTYLANSDKEGFKKFVIKTFNQYSKAKEKNDELIKEYIILKMLNGKNIAAPKVLGTHEPKKYLLMSFVEGENAALVAKDDKKSAIIFEKVGEEIGKLHTVDMDAFGNITQIKTSDWKEFQTNKFNMNAENIKEVVDKDIFDKATKRFYGYEYLLEDEAKGKPVLLPHDLHLDNFLYDEENKTATYIDYGIALAGRPFFDLAKLYIWTFNDYPDQVGNFLKGYKKYIDIPNDFNQRMEMYILRECFGMINFFRIMEDKKELKNTIDFLKDYLNGASHIQKLNCSNLAMRIS